MNVATNIIPGVPRMTREEFFPWAEVQDGRYEFDGLEPIPMTGGDFNHSTILANLVTVLRALVRGTGLWAHGPDAGVATAGNAIRYPDGMVTRTKPPGSALFATDPLVVFEVVSRTSGRTDRVVKRREYQAVPSILRYVILERTRIAATVLARTVGGDPWTVSVCRAGHKLDIPEAGIAFRLDDLYEDVDLAPSAGRHPA